MPEKIITFHSHFSSRVTPSLLYVPVLFSGAPHIRYGVLRSTLHLTSETVETIPTETRKKQGEGDLLLINHHIRISIGGVILIIAFIFCVLSAMQKAQKVGFWLCLILLLAWCCGCARVSEGAVEILDAFRIFPPFN